MLTGERKKTVGVAALAGLLAFASWVWAQGHAPIRITMEELHRGGGIPPGWKFLLPSGDPMEGKKVYIEMQCYSCHEIKGEHFPKDARDKGDVGPELTGAGRYHPAEYLAEAIVNPNRVIVEGPGYTGPDGLSKMPDYSESLTLKQLIDLVAYLKSLTTGEMHHGTTPEGSKGEHGGKAH